jgi:hypothetical protein
LFNCLIVEQGETGNKYRPGSQPMPVQAGNAFAAPVFFEAGAKHGVKYGFGRICSFCWMTVLWFGLIFY